MKDILTELVEKEQGMAAALMDVQGMAPKLRPRTTIVTPTTLCACPS